MLTPVLLVACGLSVSAGPQFEVSVSVREPAQLARLAAPVRGGVPLRRGQLRDGAVARLVDPAGRELACAVRPLARWYDGSVKWLAVDTQVDLAAGGEVRLRLLPGEKPLASRAGLHVTEDAAGITVDTGPAKFVFSRKTFGAPSEVWCDLDGDRRWETRVASAGEFVCEVEHTPPGRPEEENWLRDAAGGARERFCATPDGDYRVQLETVNALRAVVKVSGWLVNLSGRRLLHYTLRAHACAGQSDLRLLVTCVYAGQPKRDFIRTLQLRFPWESQTPSAWAFGGQTRHEGPLAAGESVSLYETGPAKIYHLAPYTLDKTVDYTVARGGQTLARGHEAPGWARVADTRSALHVAVRNFWQMHPKELAVDTRGVTVYLWPEQGGKVLDLRRRSDEVDNVYHYDLSLWPYGGEGVAVSHELLLRYGPAGEDLGAALTQGLNSPLLLECSPQWSADSGVFGPFAVADPQRFPHLEGLLNIDVEWIRGSQRAFHWDGLIDFGDTLFHGYATPSHYGYIGEQAWCSRGYVGWLCNDGTLTHSLFLHYLRTGDYQTFLTAEAMCRHVMDVDTCHYCSADPAYVGGGHRHDQQHWGNGVRGYGTATHGAIDYYLLTADERALEVAREYAQFHTDGNMGEDEDRIGGLIRFWELTGEARWKQTADAVLAQELNVPADQSWRFATGQHFRFVSNTSVSLLFYLSAAPPEDTQALRRAIRQSLDFRESAFMSTWDEAGYLTLILTALAYQDTGDPRYARMTAALTQRRTNLPRTLELPPDLPSVLRGQGFPDLVETARRWGVNNIYTANIHELCSYPYAIAAVQKAGLDEAGVWNVPRVENLPPPFEEVLLPKSIGPEIGFAYVAGLQHGSPSDVAGGHSELVLLENGRALGPAHAAHAEIRKEGRGRSSHWGARTLWFSASDNTDPRTNGREYKIVYPGPDTKRGTGAVVAPAGK